MPKAKDTYGGSNRSAMSAREQLRGLENAEPPESADDLDRMKKRTKKRASRR